MEDRELKLKFSKKTISKSTLNGNPVILIGNYLLDCLPHDAFSIKHEKLSEVLVNYQIPLTVKEPLFLSEALKHNKWTRKVVFPPSLYDGDELFTAEQLKAEEKRRAEEEGDNPATRPLPENFKRLIYYDEEIDPNARLYNQILEEYRTSFSGDIGSLLYPIGGFKMVNSLIDTFGNAMTLILGDKGDVSLSGFEGFHPPPICIHGGSLSFLSNFHALMKYWTLIHEKDKIPTKVFFPDSSQDFKVCVFSSGLESDELEELPSRYAQCNQFTVDDYYRVYRSINLKAKPSAIHALLKLSCNDPGMFYQYKDQLLKLLPQPSHWRGPIIQEVLRMWGNYYHQVSSVDEDIPYSLGEIFLACDRPKEALPFFQKSLKLSGNYYSTNYNLGLCYEKLGDLVTALSHFKACENAKVDVDVEDLSKKLEYLQSLIDFEQKQKEKEEKKREELLVQYKKEENRKNRSKSRDISMNSDTSSHRSLSNSMNSRMAKYGITIDESQKEEEEECEEEDEEIDDNYDDDPLCL